LIVDTHLLLVSGSLREASTNTAVLRTAATVAPERFSCRLYDRLARLPAFSPDDDRHPLANEVQGLRNAIHEADAIVFSIPEYAGAMPGSLKNLLDWTIGDEEVGSIYDKPVAWVNVSPRGAEGAHDELRTVLGYAHARIIEGACVHIPVARAMVDSDGLIQAEPALATLKAVLDEIAAATTLAKGRNTR